jgi:hypothetical protein
MTNSLLMQGSLSSVALVISMALVSQVTMCAAEPTSKSQIPTSVFTKADASSFSVVDNTLPCPVVVRVSPDKRYVARIEMGDGEVGYLYVGHATLGGRNNFRLTYLFKVDDVHGCIWMPNRRHTLIYSSGGADYGRGYLGVWNGRNHLLKKAKLEEGEGYDITSYEPHRHELRYDYLPPNFHATRRHKSLVLYKW